MAEKAKKTKKELECDQKLNELTADLQRTHADFENYRKRAETEKLSARQAGKAGAILKLLPVIDNIERAIAYTPAELKDNTWVQGVAGLVKNLERSLEALDVRRIEAKVGTPFDPELHEAIQFDEDAIGEHEVVAEELQAGYLLNQQPIRHAMVRVTRQ